MKGIEQIIKERKREEFYQYYLSLGYDHKVAASLALFTYGRYRFRNLSMDGLYDALCRGEEYLPPEVLEERERLKKERKRLERELEAERKHIKREKKAKLKRKTAETPDPDEELFEGPMAMKSYSIPEADACFLEVEECAAAPTGLSLMAKANKGLMAGAGAAGFATDEYEPIEEKEACTTVSEQTSTFRMTTNTASAGVVLNQLRNGRRIDRSMVRIEEMLNYFRYESAVPTEEMFKIACEIMDAEDDRKTTRSIFM